MSEKQDVAIIKARARRQVLRKIVDMGKEITQDIFHGYVGHSEYYWGIPQDEFEEWLKKEGIKSPFKF